jgi:hypothetical protein
MEIQRAIDLGPKHSLEVFQGAIFEESVLNKAVRRQYIASFWSGLTLSFKAE